MHAYYYSKLVLYLLGMHNKYTRIFTVKTLNRNTAIHGNTC